jgi:putative transcriptional regulator
MPEPYNEEYGKGYFLIANPVLPDPNFSRTVVLLCNHDDEGSFGLVINRSAPIDSKEVFAEMGMSKFPSGKIYLGGPVSPSQVFTCVALKNLYPNWNPFVMASIWG